METPWRDSRFARVDRIRYGEYVELVSTEDDYFGYTTKADMSRGDIRIFDGDEWRVVGLYLVTQTRWVNVSPPPHNSPWLEDYEVLRAVFSRVEKEEATQ